MESLPVSVTKFLIRPTEQPPETLRLEFKFDDGIYKPIPIDPQVVYEDYAKVSLTSDGGYTYEDYHGVFCITHLDSAGGGKGKATWTDQEQKTEGTKMDISTFFRTLPPKPYDPIFLHPEFTHLTTGWQK